MTSPEHSTGNSALPPLTEVVEVPARFKSLSDSISQLSQPLLGDVGVLILPTQPKVTGQTMTPEGCLIKAID